MLKIEKTVLPSPEQWEIIIEGMRNPKNSWGRIDSFTCEEKPEMTNDEIEATCGICPRFMSNCGIYDCDDHFILGPNDHVLMDQLNEGGPVHAKYRRMINVYVTLTAPLYWWKEFDTYKIGTVCNSCSTMHKIHAREFTLRDFSCEKLLDTEDYANSSCLELDFPMFEEKDGNELFWTSLDILQHTISGLNFYRERFLETKDKKYWWQMIQLLPTSYNQKRTIMLNYEVLVGIYKWRRGHKLDEWKTFIDWILSLPYSELITGEKKQ